MKTKIIAEIASSHNGDIELGKAMIRAAAEAGVDGVKFQSWQAKNIASSDPDKKRYEELELSDAAHRILKDECEKHQVKFLTTVFDIDRINFLLDLGLDTVKVASVDLKHTKLLKALKGKFAHIILSTGMSRPQEVQDAVEALKGQRITLLHCVSLYPTPIDKVNLGRMMWLKNFCESVGYSDHAAGPEAAKLAIAMGAEYVEKHFTLDRSLPQTGHQTTVEAGAKPITTHEIADEPLAFKEICDYARFVEQARGQGRIDMWDAEISVREKYTGRLGHNA
jgi:sialic acid synthase SpsE